MGAPEVNGPSNANSLWTAKKIKTPEEQQTAVGGMTASFLPNGGTFLDAVKGLGETVKESSNASGHNCGLI